MKAFMFSGETVILATEMTATEIIHK